jgi:hypothetical protein
MWTLYDKPIEDSIILDEIAGFSWPSRLSRQNSGLKRLPQYSTFALPADVRPKQVHKFV